MTTVHSFGIIPLKDKKTLLVKHQKGHWAFPKGHPNEGESPQETAGRELKEETALSVKKFLAIDPLEEHYHFEQGGTVVEKHVVYFFAEVEGDVALQHEEIAEYRWVSFEEAVQLATFSETRSLCLMAQTLV